MSLTWSQRFNSKLLNDSIDLSLMCNVPVGCFGQSGLQRKKTPNCLKHATFWGGFLMFSRSKNNFKISFVHKKLEKPPQKVAYVLMAVGRFFFSAALTAQNSPELRFCFINSFIQPSRKASLLVFLLTLIFVIVFLFPGFFLWKHVMTSTIERNSAQFFNS